MPAIAEAVGDRALLVVDGGVRRGIDVLKGLAFGADLVAIGRPALWGLAVDGTDGVQRVIELLRDEPRWRWPSPAAARSPRSLPTWWPNLMHNG